MERLVKFADDDDTSSSILAHSYPPLPPLPASLALSPAVIGHDFPASIRDQSNDWTHLFNFIDSPLFSHLPDLRSLDSPQTLGRLKRPAVEVSSQSLIARNRRRKISEKMRLLQKVLPCKKKMDTSTLLEEVFKYVKFLQAQIVALQLMPCETSFFVDPPSVYGGGELGKVSRQQVLEIVVNSAEAQSILYAKEWCVFSVEQLMVMSDRYNAT